MTFFLQPFHYKPQLWSTCDIVTCTQWLVFATNSCNCFRGVTGLLVALWPVSSSIFSQNYCNWSQVFFFVCVFNLGREATKMWIFWRGQFLSIPSISVLKAQTSCSKNSLFHSRRYNKKWKMAKWICVFDEDNHTYVISGTQWKEKGSSPFNHFQSLLQGSLLFIFKSCLI